MASIYGSLSAGYIPEHEAAVKAVLAAAEQALRSEAEKQGFDSISASHGVSDGTGWLSVSLAKTHVAPTDTSGG